VQPADAAAEEAGPAAPAPPGSPPWRLPALLAAALFAVAVAFVLDRSGSDGPAGPPPGSWTLVPHRGLGAWVDVYDWTVEFTNGTTPVDVRQIDAMADAGVQTLYLQTGHDRSADDVIEPERLGALIERAHERGLHVVAWYLPTFVDPAKDLRRLVAASELPVDGLGVDIEATTVTDPAVRNQRLLELTAALRDEVGDDKVLAAITLTPVHLQVVNPDFWPDYPWAQIGAAYDVIVPMAYWSLRTGDLRAGDRYVGETIDRIRASVGRDDVPIHVVGGIADEVTPADVEGMLAALTERGAIGGSLYDWNTSTPELWEVLQPLRALRS
jgi:hypothetical protein